MTHLLQPEKFVLDEGGWNVTKVKIIFLQLLEQVKN
jgi:hypothetical protein